MIIQTLILILASLFATVQSIIDQGTFITGQNIYQMTYNPTSTALYIHFQLFLTPFYSSALLIGRNNNFTISTSRQDWMHFDYLSHHDCDYQGMVTARSQYAWADNLGIGSTLYLKLINFDTSQPFSYIINVTQSNSFVKSCQVPSNKMSSNQYCAFCNYTQIGSYCQIQRNSITPSYQYYDTLPPQSYSYFLLLSQGEISLSLTYDREIRLYLQTQQSADELAGISNDLLGMYSLSSSSSINVKVKGQGKSILVGIINPNINNVIFSLTFLESENIDIVIIIVSILGGMLVLGIVIAGFVIYKRMGNQTRSVHPQQSLPNRNKKFTQQQVQTYFPSIQLAIISFQLQLNLQDSMGKEGNNQIECVICISAITNEQKVRVGYCKHIFHANCLSAWFRKQQNCPYCRRDYSRESTSQHYNKLVKKIGKQLLGEQIARSIFARHQNISMHTISFQATKQTFE